MTDSLQRFLFEGAPVRGEIAHLDATWRAVLERHDYPESLRVAMGELMAAAALLSATLKDGIDRYLDDTTIAQKALRPAR